MSFPQALVSYTGQQPPANDGITVTVGGNIPSRSNLAKVVQISQRALHNCPVLQQVPNGASLPTTIPGAFEIIIAHLNDRNDDFRARPQPYYTVRFAHLWVTAGQLELPAIQNRVVQAYRDLYIEMRNNGHSGPIEPAAFNYLRRELGPRSLPEEFLVHFYAGLCPDAFAIGQHGWDQNLPIGMANRILEAIQLRVRYRVSPLMSHFQDFQVPTSGRARGPRQPRGLHIVPPTQPLQISPSALALQYAPPAQSPMSATGSDMQYVNAQAHQTINIPSPNGGLGASITINDPIMLGQLMNGLNLSRQHGTVNTESSVSSSSKATFKTSPHHSKSSNHSHSSKHSKPPKPSRHNTPAAQPFAEPTTTYANLLNVQRCPSVQVRQRVQFTQQPQHQQHPAGYVQQPRQQQPAQYIQQPFQQQPMRFAPESAPTDVSRRSRAPSVTPSMSASQASSRENEDSNRATRGSGGSVWEEWGGMYGNGM